MEHNPYLQPGKHFVPRQKGNWKRSAPHRGTWNLLYNGVIITSNAPYGRCVNDRKDYHRHKDYRNYSLFRIEPYLG